MSNLSWQLGHTANNAKVTPFSGAHQGLAWQSQHFGPASAPQLYGNTVSVASPVDTLSAETEAGYPMAGISLNGVLTSFFFFVQEGESQQLALCLWTQHLTICEFLMRLF